MEKFEIMKELIGNSVKKEDLALVDCYVCDSLGIFVPVAGPCGYAAKDNHTHPSYMVTVYFDEKSEKSFHYGAEITSPETSHNDDSGLHYYCVLIAKEYFESRYRMYEEVPVFSRKTFMICADILKALNTFMFEYSKSMKNSEITLAAQAEIITHWIIRSILGESLDIRAVSSDYSVARAQHYMEQHYMENITVSRLAELGYDSPSNFAHKFKREMGITPIEYLREIRINSAKTLLRRNEIQMTEIAMRCGFGSSTYFSACFQARVGMSPTEYREKYKG